jgi:glucose/arabinose dehydrogenase
VEQGGRILVTRPRQSDTTTFLDISDDISTGGERGLLGLAFPPDYAKNGTVYIDYTDTRGDTVIARYHVSSADPDRLDADSGEVLLQIEQPFANHNGGGIVFGPDGMLWIGMGDGGSGGDPHGNGQDPGSLLGKMLRIDVGETLGRTPEGDYTIPADNPFVGRSGYRPEIWAMGLRNPWRFSFDSATGDLWIGDVGQNIWEEIDFVPAADLSNGANLGWNLMEGTHPYPSDADLGDTSGLTGPVVEYDHDAGKSVTGGIVYRGSKHPELDGVYLYADFYGSLWGLRLNADETENAALWTGDALISSFGLDEAGEVYVCDLNGTVLQVEFDLQ